MKGEKMLKTKRKVAWLLVMVMLLSLVNPCAISAHAEESNITVQDVAIDETTDIDTDATTTEEVQEEKTTATEATTEVATESSTEMTSEKTESTTEIASEAATTEVEASTETTTEVPRDEVATTEQSEESTTEEPAVETKVKPPVSKVLNEAKDTKESEKKYVIYSDGTWEDGIIWYVNPKNKHYVFCLNYGETMYTGQYEGIVAAGYSGKSAFKKAVALNYFYKTNGNKWSGKKNYGPVQEVIWDWNNSETAQKLTTYVNHAWRVTSLNGSREGDDSSSYSTNLYGINKSDQDSDSARKTMISKLTSGKHIIDVSSSFDATSASYKETIKLKGNAWKYFNNGGFNGGDSDIVVDGVYKTDGTKADGCSAVVNADGNLDVNIKPTETMGKDEASAYTVIMHINFDYKGAKKLNYLLTPSGKQNLTYDADFNTAAYFAVRVYADTSDKIPAKLYINKVDEFDTFVPGCTFQLTGVQGDALTNKVNITKTINTSSNYFKIEYPGYYKLVETAVPSSDFTIDTTEHYVYAKYNDDAELVLYDAWKNTDGTYGSNGENVIGDLIVGPTTSKHTGSGTASFSYYFPNKYTSGSANLTKFANVLVKYENGQFIYEQRTLENVGFTFHAAEDIYINDTLIFSKDEEIYSGTQWGRYTPPDMGALGVSGTYEHEVKIDGTLVVGKSQIRPIAKEWYRGYTANGGKLTISDLPTGSYYCVESDLSHPGLVMAVGRYDFDVTGGNNTPINGSSGILNKMAPADIYVYKQDENTKEYLEGAEFTLYANINNTNYDGQKLFTEAQTVDAVVQRNLITGEEVIESKTWIPIYVQTSNSNGLAMFENLPYGDYLISETKAPENYELPEKAFKFTHSLNGAEAANTHSGYVYQFNYGNIHTSDFTIYKKAEKAYLNTATEKNIDAYVYKDEAIEGAVFGVYADGEIKNTLGEVVYNQGDLVTKSTTNAEGVAQFGGAMFVGKYYFQEIQSADDSIYELDNTKHYFEITGTENTRTLTDEAILNKQVKGSVKVIKTDGVTKVALSGVEFNLLDSTQKNILGTYVTDDKGELFINNLPVGTYYLKEVSTKDNYKLDDTLREITISKEKLNHELSITNDEYKGSIKVIKTDGKTKVALSGVEFKLFDSTQKNILGTYVTDSKGEILIDNLSVGTYYLQESKTKKGYKLDDKMVEVVISVDDLHKQVEMKNYRTETKITIKTDTTYSGSGQVRTGDMSPIAFVWLLFFMSSFGLAYCGKQSDWKVSMKKVKKFMLALVFSVGVLFLGGLTVRAAAELKELRDVEYNGKIYTYALQREYETTNKDEEIAFDEEVDGMRLVDIQYEIVETILQKKTLEETKDCKDLIVKDEDKVARTITLDGNVYELQDITWSEVPNMESVNYTVDYGYQTAEPKPDATYEYTYTSPVMKEENTVSLPFVRLDKGNEDWVDGFSATVTFHNIDGLYFNIGNHEITYDSNKLSLSEADYKELVKMLGYDTSKYRLTDIKWSGKEFKNDGVTCRNAKATGQQYAASYKAYYEDEVENGKIYTAHATYVCEVEVPAEEAAPTYVMKATAYYEKPGISPVVMTVGIVILVILVVGILYVLTRKKKKVSTAPVYSDNQEHLDYHG